MKRVIVATLTSALIIAASHAGAQEQSQFRIVVRIGDIDIGTESGADQALQRIHRAAQRGCGGQSGRQTFSLRRLTEACVEQSMTRAVAQLDNPVVTARYRGSESIYAGLNGSRARS